MLNNFDLLNADFKTALSFKNTDGELYLYREPNRSSDMPRLFFSAPDICSLNRLLKNCPQVKRSYCMLSFRDGDATAFELQNFLKTVFSRHIHFKNLALKISNCTKDSHIKSLTSADFISEQEALYCYEIQRKLFQPDYAYNLNSAAYFLNLAANHKIIALRSAGGELSGALQYAFKGKLIDIQSVFKFQDSEVNAAKTLLNKAMALSRMHDIKLASIWYDADKVGALYQQYGFIPTHKSYWCCFN